MLVKNRSKISLFYTNSQKINGAILYSELIFNFLLDCYQSVLSIAQKKPSDIGGLSMKREAELTSLVIHFSIALQRGTFSQHFR
jgi:hypothetical protein